MMKAPVILVGVGEIGSVLARGMLKIGHPVYPIIRGMTLSSAAESLPEPEAVIIAVGEGDIQDVLSSVPVQWRDKLVLIQNELLPRDWQQHELENVTVISVWFEKKPGQDFKVIIPSPAHGTHATLLSDALGSIGIPVNVLSSSAELLDERRYEEWLDLLAEDLRYWMPIRRNVEFNRQEREETRELEDLDIQCALTDKTFDREPLIQKMCEAFNGDTNHNCMGRSAPGRLARAINIADEADINATTLRKIQAVCADSQ